VGRSSSAADRRMPQLSDLDLRILDLLSHHRVLTQNQLAAINPKTPARTLRYRCARLAENGLAGRSRPYRERGSAPFHLWPTRKGEAVVKGGSPPRGGDRSEPNPLFLSHAAGLSEIYVALERTLPDQVRIARFEREGEAREEFTVLTSREKRAIAPDLFIEIKDQDGSLTAFVELDMGSMSHRRLAQKAAGYADYAQAKAWQQQHPFCPALLFITTTESRARSFLAAMRRQVGRESLLLTCGCDLARELERCAVEERWLLDDEDEGMTDLLGPLMEARRPFDEWKERQAAERREEGEERERLRSDPEALAERLRGELRRGWGDDCFGRMATDALLLSLEGEGALNKIERKALEAIGGMLAEPLALRLGDREPTPSEREAMAALVAHHRANQVKRLEEAAERFGEGPKLRHRRRWLEEGDSSSAPTRSTGWPAMPSRIARTRPSKHACERTTCAGARRKPRGSARSTASSPDTGSAATAFSPKSTEPRCASAGAARRSSIPILTASTAPRGATSPLTAISAVPGC
jgi:protein involved in plasmid replication-relaxation